MVTFILQSALYLIICSYFITVCVCVYIYIYTHTHTHTLKCINCIIKCNIVLYSCFPHAMLLIILYIHLHILKYINCNIVPCSYIPHIVLLHILYIYLHTQKCIYSIMNCNIVPYSYYPHMIITNFAVYVSTHFEKY